MSERLGPPEAEEHQGDLYSRDTEMVRGWFVFGRGPTAGATHAWETCKGVARVEIRRLPDDSGTMIANTGARCVHTLVPDDVLLAVCERARTKESR